MSFFAEHVLTVECNNFEIRRAILQILETSFGLIKQSTPNAFLMNINGGKYSLFINPETRTGLTIFFMESMMRMNIKEPAIIALIGEDGEPESKDGLYIIKSKTIDLGFLRALFCYASMLNDCLPFSLHLKRPISPLTENCLRRVFRSLDADFDGRISLADLSELNYKAFGQRLSGDDLLAIFKILNEGEPLYLDTLRTYMLDIDQFEAFMSAMTIRGYGHSVFKLIEACEFPRYMFEVFKVTFKGKTNGKMGNDVSKFVTMMYNEFPDPPSHEQVMNLFKLQGGAPVRVRNTKHFTLGEWVRLWSEWCIIEPSEAARHLLAFGFPVSKLKEAFGVVEEEKGYAVPAIAAIGTISSVVGGLVLYFSRRRK